MIGAPVGDDDEVGGKVFGDGFDQDSGAGVGTGAAHPPEQDTGGIEQAGLCDLAPGRRDHAAAVKDLGA